MTLSPLVRYLTRFIALGYIVTLVVVPVGLILWRAFAPGEQVTLAWRHEASLILRNVK